MAEPATPVLFVHGLWLHATSWGPWVELFRAEGYAPTAPGWPGTTDSIEEVRKQPERVAGTGVDAAVEHYARIIRGLDARPILIGHSFGGVIVQRLLGQNLGAAGVAIDAAPVKGVLLLPPSALRVASIALRNPANRRRAISLTAEQFRYGFGNAISAEESIELYRRWNAPSPARPLFEAAAANLSPRSPVRIDSRNDARGPLLLVAGGRDATVPASITRATRRLYRRSTAVTDYHEFPDRGHSLVIDGGWREVADTTLRWLGGKVFR